MGLETATYISDLVVTNPTGTDPKSQGDDHIRLFKATVKATFPNITGAMNASHTELNYVVGVTSSIQAQLNARGLIAGQTWTGAHDFTGGTVTVPTASPGDADTSAASTAFVNASFGKIGGQTWTGAHSFTGGSITVPTAAPGTNNTTAASTAFVIAQAFSSVLPAQTVPALLYTNGSTASWRTAFVGDSGSGGQLGPVPAPAAGDAAKFLRGDATWVLNPTAPDVIVEDQKAASTVGGSLTSGANVRTLNTLVRNVGSLASLASNAVTLPAGSYYFRAKSSFTILAASGSAIVMVAYADLYNSTDSAVIKRGMNISVNTDQGAGEFGCGVAMAEGYFTLAGSKALNLRTVMPNTTGAYAGGGPYGSGTEVYSTLEIWKVG